MKKKKSTNFMRYKNKMPYFIGACEFMDKFSCLLHCLDEGFLIKKRKILLSKTKA